ncbi:Uncharacterized protein dnm_036550 [Desulfonema magnum]|uniref:Uncharacterized protein n=1 Tax=Desulfonema magnum TaxID=45655 RepID=A0A975BL88_9BACT|nr:Uncharacterized protein dnm_036550 [Desulfonema magnum]
MHFSVRRVTLWESEMAGKSEEPVPSMHESEISTLKRKRREKL